MSFGGGGCVMDRLLALFAACLVAGTSYGQPPGGAAPKLDRGLADKIAVGKGKLTDEDVIEMLPGSYRLELPGGVFTRFKLTIPDAVLVCGEVTRFRVEYKDEKAEEVSAEFSPAVKSALLTLGNFKQIKKGMPVDEVDKLLGKPTWSATIAYEKHSVRRSEWLRGREVVVLLKGGKVFTASYFEHADK